MDGRFSLAIVGPTELVYEVELFCDSKIRKARRSVLNHLHFDPTFKEPINRLVSSTAHLQQFVLYASLDLVEERMLIDTSNYLRVVDDFNNFKIFGWVTNSGSKFLLLFELPSSGISRSHLAKLEENIKYFFSGLNDLYIKAIQNPFYKRDSPIKATGFDEAVEKLARRYLFGI